jgi:membrane-associated protease RseP (regulator of RpoE activity)
VFALFAGEEIGLLGSAHYTRHPALPIDRTVAMLNFDMVGRMRNERLDVSGVESGIGLRALVTGAAAGDALDLVVHGTPFAPSDHASFYSAGVPVLFFHTGTHADYHGPGDTADKLNAAGMAEVARLATRIVERLAEAPRPSYVKLAPEPSGPRMTGAPGGAFLGVSVDGRSDSDGVRLGSVISGSAAERAGLRDGDVIVRLDGLGLQRFEDLRRALAHRQPGDRVTLVYLRDGEERRTTAVLDARP